MTTLRQRLAQAQKARDEGKSSTGISLVVQGGGMRGVYSAAVLRALLEEGGQSLFDYALGSSSGAINAAYFLAGESEMVTAYVEHLSNRRFINRLRLNRIIDIDYMVDEVIKPMVPINKEALLGSPTEYVPVLTDAENGEAYVPTKRQVNEHFYDILKATSALPGLYNKTIPIGGHWYVDGGMAEALPVQRAIDMGAQDLLVVTTNSLDFRRNDLAWRATAVCRFLARNQSSAVRRKLGKPDTNFNEAMDLVQGIELIDNLKRIWVVSPGNRMPAGSLTNNRKRLDATANLGADELSRSLDLGPASLHNRAEARN